MLELLTTTALSALFFVLGAFGWYVADKQKPGWEGAVARMFETLYGKIWK